MKKLNSSLFARGENYEHNISPTTYVIITSSLSLCEQFYVRRQGTTIIVFPKVLGDDYEILPNYNRLLKEHGSKICPHPQPQSLRLSPWLRTYPLSKTPVISASVSCA